MCYTAGMYRIRKPGEKPRYIELRGDYKRDLRSARVGYNLTIRVAKGVPALSEILPSSSHLPDLTPLGARLKMEFEGTLCRLAAQAIWVKSSIFMPDHIHVCFWVAKPLHLSVLQIVVRALMFTEKTVKTEVGLERIWSPPGHLFQCYSWEILQQKITYNLGNVARWKMDHHAPELSHPHMLVHPKLTEKYAWEGYGAVALLDGECCMPCYISSRATEEDVARFQRLALIFAHLGWTFVGGFVSPRERALLKALREVREARFIHLAATRLVDEKVPAKLAKSLACGHFLRLTSAEGREACTREICVRQNVWAEGFCRGWREKVEAHFLQKASSPKVMAYVRDFLQRWRAPR